LRGTISVPSDKSIAHRALICAALAHGESRIVLHEPGEDVRSTLSALRSLGVDARATDLEEGLGVRVVGLGTDREIGRLGGGTVDCGNSGTSMRLLTGALASGGALATLVGDESLSRRPMARVADPLRAMGAEIDLNDGHAPVIVSGRRPLRAMDHKLNVASAQVLGAIAFAALAAEARTNVFVPGEVRDHTERMLGALGADIERSTDDVGTRTSINGPGALRPFEIDVPGDFSSAAAWLVAAALHPDAAITIQGVSLNPSRTALVAALQKMGANVRLHEIHTDEVDEPIGVVDVRGGSSLQAITLTEADIAPLIDELPLLAVAMAAANGTSEVRGAGELRVKESDRISAIGAALRATGATFEELEDGWRITGGAPLDARIATHGDHRIAMSMAVAAWTGVASGVELDDSACVAVSYPTFWRDARRIGAFE
jgi:3-phosphoshikimate 1-carboxyvinyltransferase